MFSPEHFNHQNKFDTSSRSKSDQFLQFKDYNIFSAIWLNLNKLLGNLACFKYSYFIRLMQLIFIHSNP